MLVRPWIHQVLEGARKPTVSALTSNADKIVLVSNLRVCRRLVNGCNFYLMPSSYYKGDEAIFSSLKVPHLSVASLSTLICYSTCKTCSKHNIGTFHCL